MIAAIVIVGLGLGYGGKVFDSEERRTRGTEVTTTATDDHDYSAADDHNDRAPDDDEEALRSSRLRQSCRTLTCLPRPRPRPAPPPPAIYIPGLPPILLPVLPPIPDSEARFQRLECRPPDVGPALTALPGGRARITAMQW